VWFGLVMIAGAYLIDQRTGGSVWHDHLLVRSFSAR
jgi:hypothetical protein